MIMAIQSQSTKRHSLRPTRKWPSPPLALGNEKSRTALFEREKRDKNRSREIYFYRQLLKYRAI
jgi:hypothetical protein